MTTWKQLSRPLRLAIAAPWCLLAAFAAVAATPATRALLLDAASKPTDDVSFTSPHWTGTLDPARLPASVAQYASDQSLTTPGAVALGGYLHDQYGVLLIDDAGQFFASRIYSRTGDPSIDLSDPATGVLRDDGVASLSWTYDGIEIPGSVSVAAGAIILSVDGTAEFSGPVQCAGGVGVGGGYAQIDDYGNIQTAGFLATDGGNITSDGSGNLTVYGLNTTDAVCAQYLYVSQSLGFYGSYGPNSQPSAITDATDLDSVVAGFNALKADMASYGLIAP